VITLEQLNLEFKKRISYYNIKSYGGFWNEEAHFINHFVKEEDYSCLNTYIVLGKGFLISARGICNHFKE